MILADIGQGQSDLAEDAIKEMDSIALDLIPGFVQTLYVWPASRQSGNSAGTGTGGEGGFGSNVFPAVRRIATLSARAVRAARTGAAAVRTDGTCGNGGRANLLPSGLREPFGYPGTSGVGNPGRL